MGFRPISSIFLTLRFRLSLQRCVWGLAWMCQKRSSLSPLVSLPPLLPARAWNDNNHQWRDLLLGSDLNFLSQGPKVTTSQIPPTSPPHSFDVEEGLDFLCEVSSETNLLQVNEIRRRCQEDTEFALSIVEKYKCTQDGWCLLVDLVPSKEKMFTHEFLHVEQINLQYCKKWLYGPGAAR